MQLEISKLTKLYGQERGLATASFNVAKGELIAIVGHNGAGKSTLLKMLASWIVPNGGDVKIDGIDLKNREQIVRKVGFIPEDPNLFDFFRLSTTLNFLPNCLMHHLAALKTCCKSLT